MAKQHGKKSNAIRVIPAEQPMTTIKEIQTALAAKAAGLRKPFWMVLGTRHG